MNIFYAVIPVALTLLVSTAHSAQIRLKSATADLVAVEFLGEIQPSDADSLKRLIETRISSANKFRWIYLNSHGGDVATAMKIGRYLRTLEFDTTVDASARCLSSCVLIFAAGLNKTVAATNIIGIHRPFGASTGSRSREDATKMYREMTAQVYAYFDEMNIPRSLPEEMLRVPPEQMRMLTFDEVEQFGLVGKDPVEQELDDSANANRFGISRQEYIARRSRALQSCKLPPPNAVDVECYKAILMGKR